MLRRKKSLRKKAIAAPVAAHDRTSQKNQAIETRSYFISADQNAREKEKKANDQKTI